LGTGNPNAVRRRGEARLSSVGSSHEGRSRRFYGRTGSFWSRWNHRDALFRFIDDPLVPIDNSPTEREFQNVAKLRLNMLFAGSTEGAHRACVLLGIIATCRALKVPAQAYLTWASQRLGTHRDLFDLPLEALTPAAFKKTLG
jgi:Transposase IS66 family